MILKTIGTGSQDGNCYALISEEGEILLLDCGCNYRKIIKGIEFKISDVAGCLLTHIHEDHCLAANDLCKHGIEVFTNKETKEHFASVENVIWKQEKKAFRVGHRFTVTPFYLPHTTKDTESGKVVSCANYGYHITHEEMGQLVYMTDFSYPTMSFKAAKVEHFLCEVNYCEGLTDRQEVQFEHRIRGHMGLDTFIDKVLRHNISPALRTVALCHLSDSDSDEELILSNVREVTGKRVEVNIATAGKTVPLNRFPF